ncbi:MAG TPA: hypothetical protein VFR24_25260 [Candidatus Angelobacter sp.]|nr:hypothetical protein [Candidatus Angelobacter sp.]
MHRNQPHENGVCMAANRRQFGIHFLYGFGFIDHGDAREQEWWPLLAETFSRLRDPLAALILSLSRPY